METAIYYGVHPLCASTNAKESFLFLKKVPFVLFIGTLAVLNSENTILTCYSQGLFDSELTSMMNLRYLILKGSTLAELDPS